MFLFKKNLKKNISKKNYKKKKISYELTIVVAPKIHALFVSETAEWEKYFGTDPSCLTNMAKLNNEWDTVGEYFYFT